MADSRRGEDLAAARRDEEDDARRQQDRDAARIHSELAETDRIAAAIDRLLDER